jgi:hypothetical protein
MEHSLKRALAIRAYLAFGWTLSLFFSSVLRTVITIAVFGAIGVFTGNYGLAILIFLGLFIILCLVMFYLASTWNVPKRK